MSRTRRDRTRFRPAMSWRHAVAPGSLDRLSEVAYIRFAGTEIDASSGQPSGVFQVAYRIRRNDASPAPLRAAVATRLRWCDQHRRQPRRLSHRRHRFRRSASGDWLREPVAISWFKPQATVHLGRMRALVALLRSHGLVIQELRTRAPGYITYEDEYQVVAVPLCSLDIAPCDLLPPEDVERERGS